MFIEDVRELYGHENAHFYEPRDGEVALYLIKAGANINLQDEDLFTPLHFACMFSTMEVIEALLTKGADFNVKNNKMGTALDIAKARNSPDILALLEKYQNEKKKVILLKQNFAFFSFF